MLELSKLQPCKCNYAYCLRYGDFDCPKKIAVMIGELKRDSAMHFKLCQIASECIFKLVDRIETLEKDLENKQDEK